MSLTRRLGLEKKGPMSEPPRTRPLPELSWLAEDFQRRWRRGDCITVEAYREENAAPHGDALLDLMIVCRGRWNHPLVNVPHVRPVIVCEGGGGRPTLPASRVRPGRQRPVSPGNRG